MIRWRGRERGRRIWEGAMRRRGVWRGIEECMIALHWDERMSTSRQA